MPHEPDDEWIDYYKGLAEDRAREVERMSGPMTTERLIEAISRYIDEHKSLNPDCRMFNVLREAIEVAERCKLVGIK